MSTYSRLGRFGRVLLLVVLSCGVLLALGGGVASAKIAHKSEGSFTASEIPGGSFGYLLALSVDNSTGPSTGDVYVGGLSFSSFSGYVYKFDANGKYTGVELNGSETPSGSFAFFSPSTGRGSRGLAVDSSSGANKGDVYVADAEHLVIDRFSESGKFLCQISGREYASLSSTEQAAECAGSAGSKTPQGGFTEGSSQEAVLGVAVNPLNGDVYVSDPSHGVIDEFNEAGEYIGEISDSHLTSPAALAFDSSGDLYADNGAFIEGGSVVKFDAGGSFAAVLDSGPAGYVAVNPSIDSVFVFDGNAVEGKNETAEYDSSGNRVSTFGQKESGAIGVSASSGRIYLGPLPGPVSMYGPAVVIPDTTATPASEVMQFTATLNGEVNPAGGGNVESCQFEYGTSTSYGQTAPCSPATPYASTTSVSASLSALAPETTYHFRVAASNSNGVVSYSSDETLTTPAAVVTGQASSVAGKSATLGGTVDPDGTTITDCHFEYGQTTHYGESQPCASTPSGSSAVAVSADITGLAENTTYHFRLVAGNSGGSYPGLDETFTTLSRPLIDTAYTSNLTESSVDMNAEINPVGFDTTYHFEWGTSTSYGNSVPVPDADIGSGSSDVLVSQHVSGLSANTTYHWRVVATNSIGTTFGQDRTFIFQTAAPFGVGCSNEALRVEQVSTFLPDCRAYEQVSPVDKDESDVKNDFKDGYMHQQASVDGERVFYESIGAFPESPKNTLYTQYLASRGASGWSTQAVDLPTREVNEPGENVDEYTLVPLSPDLSTGLIRSENALVADAPGPEIWNLYVGHLLTGSYELVTDVNPPHQKGNSFGVTPIAASTDFSHVLFFANDALTPEAPSNGYLNLYEWAEGQIHLVGLIPTSGTSCTGSQCTPAAGQTVAGGGSETWNLHAISANGSRVFFTADGNLYVRIDDERTVQVDASQRTPSAGSGGGHYQEASVDGSHVLFTSSEPLTNDAVPGSGGNLYDYDVETGQLADLTVANDAGSEDVVGVSEDFSHVYFIAKGVLTPPSQRNENGEHAEAGKYNLYLWNSGQTTFIFNNATGTGGVSAPRVTPDGAHLAFESMATPTGYDNTFSGGGSCASLSGQAPAGGCQEVFLYDAGANRLICASCNPSGARPVGSSELLSLTGSPGTTQFTYRPHELSADGSRLFFTSSDVLLPADTNGLDNVYEWEAEGSGSCQSSTTDGGCLYLTSSGSGTSNSYFADASASGNDVFFETGDSLVGQDEDNLEDLYDARVGGGFASQGSRVVVPPCTSLEGCLSPLSEPPAQLAVASAELHGSGNLVTPPEAPPTAVEKTAAQIRAEKLTKALNACKKKPKKKRAKCQKQANKSFGKAK
jgi:hypothetical protein